MKRFKNNVISKKVAEAIIVAERLLLSDSAMISELQGKDDFRFNSGNGFEICHKILACTVVAPVFTYRPKWRFSKAIGMTQNGAIHLNIYKLEALSHVELTGLLVHEYFHMCNFGHGNNYKTAEKVKFSVPYFASENISRWL